MKLTRERLEHELMKIKQQFPATHVGFHGSLGINGNHCLMGQVFVNVGLDIGRAFDEEGGLYFASFFEGPKNAASWYRIFGTEVASVMAIIVRRNDDGATWHSIIDSIVPPTAIEVKDVTEAEELIIEPTPAEIRRGEEPAALPVARIMERLGEGARGSSG